MSDVESECKRQDSEVFILTHTCSASYINLDSIFCIRYMCLNNLKDVAISAVCQLEQMHLLIDWEGFIVSVIKAVTNRRETHSGWIQSLGNNLFGVNWTCLKLKHKDAVFRDFFSCGGKEEASSDECHIDSASLSCTILCSLFSYEKSTICKSYLDTMSRHK